MIKNSFLNQTEVLSILGGIFVFNDHDTAGWILISLGVIGSFTKFAMNFQAEHQKEEKRLLAESEKGLNELTKKLADMS